MNEEPNFDNEENSFDSIIDELTSGDIDVNTDHVFKVTQNIRRQFIAEKLKDGSLMLDPKQQSTLLAGLKDMDKQQLDRKRLDVDEQNGANNKIVQEIVMQMALKNPKGMAKEPSDDIPVPDLDDAELPEVEFSEEELTPGLIRENSKEFVERMKEKGVA